MLDALALHPAEQPPGGRRDVLAADPAHRRIDLLVLVDTIDRLRAVEGDRVVLVAIPESAARVPEVRRVLADVDGGLDRQELRGDVVGAAAEVVVGVPVDVRGEDCDVGRRLLRRDDPRKAEERAGATLHVEVVEAAALRGGDDIARVRSERIAVVVPVAALRREIAVRQDLAIAARPERFEQPEVGDLLLAPAVPPEAQVERFGRMDPQLRRVAAADPLRPHVAEQPV